MTRWFGLAWLLVSLSLAATIGGDARAQTAVRVPVTLAPDKSPLQLSATLYRPAVAATTKSPAVALFHGCGGVGQNIQRMAGILQAKGYVALVVDSFGARGIRDACTSAWPTQAQANERAQDVAQSARWLLAQPFVGFVGVMGYSYGGGVALMNGMSNLTDAQLSMTSMMAPPMRATIAVYPDCALMDAAGPGIWPWRPLFIAMAELDDWTPVRQCDGMLARVRRGRELIETKVYPGAHHSFDAVGLPVRYLAAAGNRSKPNNCCGAHYGHNPEAWARFQVDTLDFFARTLGGRR